MGNNDSKSLKNCYENLTTEEKIQKDEQISKCETKIKKLKKDIRDLKENGETSNVDRDIQIQKIEEKIKVLEQVYNAGDKNLKDLSEDYYDLKGEIKTFIEEEKMRNTARIDDIAKHDDQIKNLESNFEAGKKDIMTLHEIIGTQKEQIVQLERCQRENEKRFSQQISECNDTSTRRFEELLTNQRKLENQCINIAKEQQREMEICKKRIKAVEIQSNGLVNTATETTDSLRETNDSLKQIRGIILNLMYTQETAPQNIRALQMNQNEDDDASCRGGGSWMTAPGTNANRYAFD